MQNAAMRLWNQLISVQTTRPPAESPWPHRIWSVVCIGIGSLFLLLLSINFGRTDIARASILWQLMHGLRAALLIGLSLWLAWRQPWRQTTPLEQCQGRIVATLCVVIFALALAVFALDSNLHLFPIQHISFWAVVFCISIQIICIVRRGMVQLAATLTVLLLSLHQLANVGESLVMSLQASPFVYALIILCSGLLIRWWIGLVMAAVLPFIALLSQMIGLAPGQTDWRATLTTSVLLGAIAGVIALYARSLETALALLERRRQELVRTSDEMYYVLETARSANAMRSQLTAAVSHELRVPLTSMLGFVDLLRSQTLGQLTADQQNVVGRIRQSGEYLLMLINDVLDFSKIEAGANMLREEPIAFGALVQDVVVAIQPQVEAKQLDLSVDIATDFPPFILSDGLRLRQVLFNLLSNAIKFTDQGSIRLRVKRVRPQSLEEQTLFAGLMIEASDLMVCAVEDTGIGIAPDDLERIFEPFWQVDNDQQFRHTGTGLGLAISKQLITVMGGILNVASSPGQGSVFTVMLPLKMPERGAARPAVADSPKSTSVPAASPSKSPAIR
ncbi:MAG: HAMP domain-containing histidine kinase [Chloroflexales bacterium]|nr:HAMP domain-containing histidine kinase [Chloroflexales bacterium]